MTVDCVVCDDLGCEHCPAVSAPEGYDSLVDRLMAEGYDRDEAERRATAILEDDAA